MKGEMKINQLKTWIAQRFETLYFFYTYMGNRLFLLLIFNFLMAFLDGIGLMMFVPLLQVADDPTASADSNQLIGWVTQGFALVNLPLNVYVMLAFITTVFILKAICSFFTQYFQTVTLQRFIGKIRKNQIDGLTTLRYKAFVSTDAGHIQNSLTVESQRIAFAGAQYIETIKAGMLVLVYLGFAFRVDWQFSLLIVVGGALTNFVYKRFYKKTKELSREITQNNHRFGGGLIESVNHFKYLKASGRNSYFGDRLTAELNDWIENNIKVGKLSALLNAIREPMMIIIVCATIAIQVSVFKSGLSAIIVILLLFYRAMTYIINLQTTWNNYLASHGSKESVLKFIKYLGENAELRNGTKVIDHIETIELRDIELAFGDFKVLKGIDIQIPAKQSVAFVGESGSGKSTLVNVLCAVLEFDSGAYYINNIPVQEIDRAAYKAKIGYISQEPTIFNADIYDNVTFWAERTPENIRKFETVMERCSMTQFLAGLPRGYKELLGHNGMNISGGQKQRISIARELFKDVELLIMDEATSALDSETENEIRKSLEELQGSLTIVSIAHRLSTIRHADQIYLMEAGKIVAQGNFEELKNRSEYFKKLTDLQGI